jgi:hypothetical protein
MPNLAKSRQTRPCRDGAFAQRVTCGAPPHAPRHRAARARSVAWGGGVDRSIGRVTRRPRLPTLNPTGHPTPQSAHHLPGLAPAPAAAPDTAETRDALLRFTRTGRQLPVQLRHARQRGASDDPKQEASARDASTRAFARDSLSSASASASASAIAAAASASALAASSS